HHHADHVGGVDELLAEHPAPVYGPSQEASRISAMDHALQDQDHLTLDFLDTTFEVLAVPGHTLGHIAYFANGILFAGDTLFRAGCGRVFEGTHAQMQSSLAKLAALPNHTRVYAGHEYTLANLEFARKVEPDNPDIEAALKEVRRTRAQRVPS